MENHITLNPNKHEPETQQKPTLTEILSTKHKSGWWAMSSKTQDVINWEKKRQA